MTTHIAIGNSDDKLTQRGWSVYCEVVDDIIRDHADEVHGEWYSLPNSEYQNACWAIEIDVWSARSLQDKLRRAALLHNQDSVAWTDGYTDLLEAE